MTNLLKYRDNLMNGVKKLYIQCRLLLYISIIILVCAPLIYVNLTNGKEMQVHKTENAKPYKILEIVHSKALEMMGTNVENTPDNTRITMLFKLDGWHIDYDMINPLVVGGHVHFVVDPKTGKIIEKEFEQ